MKERGILVRDFSHYYGGQRSLNKINLDVYRNEILGIIGPARRLNDLIPGSRVEGKIMVDDQDIYGPEVDVVALRRKLGMVFATPVPLPLSIYENIIFGVRLLGNNNRDELDRIVEDSLEKAGLWAEVKDRLHTSALKLSGGQQQRLCIARSLALDPEVLLLDEP
ncbi:MAG: ATP-binding cassette domain-containing protein, partial [Candidatus Saccharicenans sp.]|nr:ATP-binding cassette domain-containing protein [Candidatus Saccharicenans sp.]